MLLALAMLTDVDGPVSDCDVFVRVDSTLTVWIAGEAVHDDVKVKLKTNGAPCFTLPVAGLGEVTVQPVGAVIAGIEAVTVALGAILIALSEHVTVWVPGTGAVKDVGVQEREKSLVATVRWAVRLEV